MSIAHADFAARLRARMAELGLTQVGLAELSGAGQGLVSRWLLGSWPRADALPGLAAALGWSVDYLLTGAESAAARRPLGRSTIDGLIRDALIPEAPAAAARRGRKRRPA